MSSIIEAVRWSDAVDGILASDQVLAVAYVTPARGVVLLPVTNTGLRDRAAGRLTPFTTSIGMWRKLAAIQREPRIAVAYHTRTHGFSERPEYVLVQGRATLGPPVADFPGKFADNWERLEPWRDIHPLWKRWMRVYALRIEVRIAVERMIVWPDLACRGTLDVIGAPLPAAPPPPQDPPAKGTAPRVDQARAAKQAARLPDVLLGWVGADGFPVATAAQVGAADERGIAIETPAGLVPPGGRRAGLLAHWFTRGVVGQRQQIYTGWMEAEPGSSTAVSYSPHTRAAYRMPNSRVVYRIAAGAATRLRLRNARRAGTSFV